MSQTLPTPIGPVAVRPAVPEDAAPLRALRLEALADYPAAFAADYDMSAAETAGLWEKRIAGYSAQDTGLICVAVAERQPRLVGMAGLYRGDRPKTRHSGTVWGVYVSPDWRGLHIAEAVIAECLAWGRVRGVVVAKLGVLTTNTPAVRCYSRCGFSVYGVEPKAIFHDGIYHDELLMSRLL